MGNYQLKDILAVFSASTTIFAAWIFLSFLGQRYVSAYDRYRTIIQDYRSRSREDPRRAELQRQIILYKKRCEQMRSATTLGTLSAVGLVSAIIVALLQVVLQWDILKHLSVALGLAGLVLVLGAALQVLRENASIEQAIEGELRDLEELR